jgi:hypothetical protein
VTCRHPLLLASAFLFAWAVRSDVDWKLLSLGGKGLFSSSPLSVYAKTSGLQAGPPSLVVVRGLNLLPGTAGLWVSQALMAFMGWFMIYLVERWTVAGATWRRAPLGPGLLTLAVGVPVLEQWGWLAGDTPHPEDALAVLTLLLALRALTCRRELRGALLIGLAIAWKPWAIAALPSVLGTSRKLRALVIAVAVPAACWLPFLLGDPSTLSAVGHGFTVQPSSLLRVMGFSGNVIPDWWRTLELACVLAGAALAARRDWRVGFAAGCAVRLMLDPAGYEYYYAGLIMVTALTERLVGARPWRTALVWLGAGFAPFLATQSFGGLVQFGVLAIVLVGWVLPWRRPAGIGFEGAAVLREQVPAQRDPEHRELTGIRGGFSR